MDRRMYLDTCLLGSRTGITNVRGLLTVTPLLRNENLQGMRCGRLFAVSRNINSHPSLSLVVCHISSQVTQIDLLYRPGHSHIRDCGMSILHISSEKLLTSYYLAQTFPGEKDADEYTMALQSGRFMETVGTSHPPCHVPRELSCLDYCRLAE